MTDEPEALPEESKSEEPGEPESPSACFLDTNILVYAVSSGAPLHQRASEEIRKRHESGQELWVSRQVLREYLAALSRPQTYSHPRPIHELIGDVRFFLRHFRIAEEGPAVTEELLSLLEGREGGGKQVHDANVVATMRVHGIPTLLTNNARDFVRFADVIQVISLEKEEEN